MRIFSGNKIIPSKIKLFEAISFLESSSNHTGVPHLYPPFFVWDSISQSAFKQHLPRVFNRGSYSLYIHFPFCEKKCSFCKQLSFVPLDKSLYGQYEEAVIKEIILYSAYLKNSEIILINLGGGTPTLFNLDKILKSVKYHFRTSKNLIINVEATLNSLNEKTISNLKEVGTTRLVVGIQSFDKKVLLKNNRGPQDVERFKEMIKSCRKAGIPYINIELIAGLPSQSLKSLFSDLANVLDSGVDSLQVYPLLTTPVTGIWKENPWSRRAYIKRRPLAMFKKAIKLLKKRGLRESCYDLCRNMESCNPVFLVTQTAYDYGGMVGVGLGSYSRYYYGRLESFQYVNTTNLDEYLCKVNSGDFPVQKACSLRDKEVLRLFLIRALGVEKMDYTRLYNELKNIFSVELGRDELKSAFHKEFELLTKIGKVNDNGGEFIEFGGVPWKIFSKLFYSNKVLLKCMKALKEYRGMNSVL